MHWSTQVLLILSWVGSEIFLLSAQLALRSASWCRMAVACHLPLIVLLVPAGQPGDVLFIAFEELPFSFFFPSHPLTFH